MLITGVWNIIAQQLSFEMENRIMIQQTAPINLNCCDTENKGFLKINKLDCIMGTLSAATIAFDET